MITTGISKTPLYCDNEPEGIKSLHETIQSGAMKDKIHALQRLWGVSSMDRRRIAPIIITHSFPIFLQLLGQEDHITDPELCIWVSAVLETVSLARSFSTEVENYLGHFLSLVTILLDRSSDLQDVFTCKFIACKCNAADSISNFLRFGGSDAALRIVQNTKLTTILVQMLYVQDNKAQKCALRAVWRLSHFLPEYRYQFSNAVEMLPWVAQCQEVQELKNHILKLGSPM
jgi:hypothetical protein